MEKLINQKESLEDKLFRDFHGHEVIIDSSITELPTVDDSCLEYFKNIVPEDSFIRIAIEGGGCAGFQYAFYINEGSTINKEYDIILANNPLVIVDSESIKYMKGAIIKYDNTPFSQRVYIDNPGAKQSCGCGSSFSYEL